MVFPLSMNWWRKPRKRQNGGQAMDEQKKMDKLYELLEQEEKRKDTKADVALRWEIFRLEGRKDVR